MPGRDLSSWRRWAIEAAAVLFIAIAVFLYLPACVLTGFVGRTKGRSFVAWAGIAFFLTPILGLIAAAAVPPKPRRTESEREPSSNPSPSDLRASSGRQGYPAGPEPPMTAGVVVACPCGEVYELRPEYADRLLECSVCGRHVRAGPAPGMPGRLGTAGIDPARFEASIQNGVPVSAVTVTVLILVIAGGMLYVRSAPDPVTPAAPAPREAPIVAAEPAPPVAPARMRATLEITMVGGGLTDRLPAMHFATFRECGAAMGNLVAEQVARAKKNGATYNTEGPTYVAGKTLLIFTSESQNGSMVRTLYTCNDE